jgi:hypothetical protein
LVSFPSLQQIPGAIYYKEKRVILTHSFGGFSPQLMGHISFRALLGERQITVGTHGRAKPFPLGPGSEKKEKEGPGPHGFLQGHTPIT